MRLCKQTQLDQHSVHTNVSCLPAAAGPYDVTMVSPRNYFLYTPLLPSAATGTVEPRSIVDPVRSHIPDTVGLLRTRCLKSFKLCDMVLV